MSCFLKNSTYIKREIDEVYAMHSRTTSHDMPIERVFGCARILCRPFIIYYSNQRIKCRPFCCLLLTSSSVSAAIVFSSLYSALLSLTFIIWSTGSWSRIWCCRLWLLYKNISMMRQTLNKVFRKWIPIGSFETECLRWLNKLHTLTEKMIEGVTQVALGACMTYCILILT